VRLAIGTAVMLALLIGGAWWQRRAWEREQARRRAQAVALQMGEVAVALRVLSAAFVRLTPTAAEASRQLMRLAQQLRQEGR
jgi:hypothetical protein